MPSEKWREINAEINKIDMRLQTDFTLTDEQYIILQNELCDLYRKRQQESGK